MSRHSKTPYVLLICIAAAGISFFGMILQPSDGYSADIAEGKIVGIVSDLAYHPIAGVPFMLYAGRADQGDCIYARISDRKGHFWMPKPKPGIYHFAVIIDKQRHCLAPFRVLPNSEIVDLRLVYSGAAQAKVSSVPKWRPLRPSPPKKEESKTHRCTLEGQIFIEGKVATNIEKLKIQGQHQEQDHHPEKDLAVKNGRYHFTGLLPGPYRFAAYTEGYPVVENLEMFILEDQENHLDIHFEKASTTPQSSSVTNAASSGIGADISITVIDAGWSPQAGADVTVQSLDGGYSKTAQTNQSGETVFKGVPPGQYRVRSIFNGVNGRCELEEQVTVFQGRFLSLVLRESR